MCRLQKKHWSSRMIARESYFQVTPMEVLNKLRPGYTVHGFRSSFADWAAEHD